MQTREPVKRTYWIFVAILAIALPLLFSVLYIMNSTPNNISANVTKVDSVKSSKPDSLKLKKSTTVQKSLKK